MSKETKFKASNGKWLIKSLFLEMNDYDTTYAIFTKKDEDHEHKGKLYKSAKKLFVESRDPTGYTFAQKHLGGWPHWKALSASPQMLPVIEEWQEELEVCLRSEGVRGIINDSLSGSRSAVTSQKWLADKGWVEKRKAGRPSKKEVEGELKAQSRVKDEIDDDLNRITIN